MQSSLLPLLSAALLLVATGCDNGDWGGSGSGDGLGNPDGDGSDAAPWQEGSDGDEIWDLVWHEERCEGYDGVAIPGATSFFAGDFRVDLETGEASGREYWLLKSNPRWQETGNGDCQVVWMVDADIAEASCSGCAFDLIVEGTMSQALSDCPDGLQDLEKEWVQRYAVVKLPDGSLFWNFADDEGGDLEEFSEGFWDGTRFVFLTEPTCMFF